MKNNLFLISVFLILLGCSNESKRGSLDLSSAIARVESPYNEAPELAIAVAKGNLPPITERLPVNLQIIAPFNKIGKYGDELRFELFFQLAKIRVRSYYNY